MNISVRIEVGERYDTLVTNTISLDLPGKERKGANLVKEHLSGFVQDACDVLIPQTISDLDEKVEEMMREVRQESTGEVRQESTGEDLPDGGVPEWPIV